MPNMHSNSHPPFTLISNGKNLNLKVKNKMYILFKHIIRFAISIDFSSYFKFLFVK